jgi:hypothetical protein
VRQYDPGAFLIIGTFEDARITRLMDAVFATTDTTDTIVPQLRLFDSRIATAGSTTFMSGPSGEVHLYVDDDNAGEWWYIVNNTPQDIPIKQTNGLFMTGYLQSIPKGQAAVIKHYGGDSFKATVSHPVDSTSQIIKDFRVQEYVPSITTTVIHVPYNPDGTGVELQSCSLIHITAPNTVVHVHLGLLQSVYPYTANRGIYHFINESNTAITIMGSEATIINYSQNTTLLDATTNGFILALATDQSTYWLYTNSIELPFIPANVPISKRGTRSPCVAIGEMLCCCDNQTVQLHPAETLSIASISDNRESAYYIRNISQTDVTLIYSTSSGNITTTIQVNDVAYMKLVDDSNWIRTTPIIHVPAPSVDTTDPMPNGSVLEISAPSFLWLYADFRTIGFEWNIVNNATTDCTFVLLNSATGSASQTYISGGTTIPAGSTAMLRQISMTNYVLLAPSSNRSQVRITTNGAVLNGTHANKFCIISIAGAGPFSCVLSSENMVDGAEIDIFNRCATADVVLNTTTGTIISRDNLRNIPPSSAVTVKFMSSIPGFAVVGGLL